MSLFGEKKETDGGVFPCPKQFEKPENFVLMITDRNLYKYSPQFKRIWQTDLRDIHSIDIDAHTHEVMTLALRCTKGNGLAPTKKGSAGIYAEFIYNEICQSESIMGRDLWATALSRVCRVTYQKFFENVLIPAPEVYQWNVFGNKLNENGKLQVRCLVASTTRLYNVKINVPGMEMERKPQWAFNIASLVALVTYGDNPLGGLAYTTYCEPSDRWLTVLQMFSLRVAPKTPGGMGRTHPMRELVTYVVSHVNERNFIVHDLKRLYRYNQPTKTLPEHHEKDHTKTIKSQSWLKSLISLNFGSGQ